MPTARQNALVQKYCTVCHTDAAKNGGLSLEHFDAAQPNPPLAAMLLSKLQNGAIGAAGLAPPDKATADAWVAATTAQAEHAGAWHVTRNGSSVAASIVHPATPRQPGAHPPLYRLTLTCDTETRRGAMQLTWSPEPKTDRTFFVSVDGGAGVAHVLEGRETMGNGSRGTTGLASALLWAPLAKDTLMVTELFPAEAVVFPIGALSRTAVQDLTACFQSSGGRP